MKTVEQQISQEYDCIDKLGSGAFGHLILVRSKNNNEQYACKIEKNHGKKIVLVEKQFKMLVSLIDTKRFPEVYTFKILQLNSYMIMEKLNKNLDDIFKQNKKQFSLKTIALLINQLMLSIEALHRYSILHRDIKPENIMTCFKSHTIKIIDFGLADNLFVKQSVALIGNVRFCSRKAHFGLSGKKQDLENMIFVIYYFLTQLPWADASQEDIHKQIRRQSRDSSAHQQTYILSKKQNFLEEVKYPPTKNLVKLQFYDQLHQIASKILNFEDDTQIDYKLLIHMTERLMTIIGVNKGDCYDWCTKSCSHYKPFKMYWNAFQ